MYRDKLRFLKEAENRESFFRRIAQIYPSLDYRYRLIEQAYSDAKDAFRGVARDGGVERYFEHIRAVALILIDYLRITDHRVIVAALLHDIVEDIPSWTIERVSQRYCDEIALWVQYLSKPAKREYPDKAERERVYYARLGHAPRTVVVIKLADRWHNLITLASCTPEKRRRKIAETVERYLPLAIQEIVLIHEIEEEVKQHQGA